MKKYLKYLIFIFIAFLSFKLPVFAAIYTNTDKYYNITIPNYHFEEQLVDDTHTFKDFVQFLSNFESDYYDIYIFANPFNGYAYALENTNNLLVVDIGLVSKQSDYTYGTLFAYRYSSSSSRFRYFTTNENVLTHSYANGRAPLTFQSTYIHNNVYEISDLFTDDSTLAFIDCYVNNNCTNFQSGNIRFSNKEVSFSTNLSNTNSPDINFSNMQSLSSVLLYYSSKDLILTAPTTNLSYDIYIKTPRINGDIYNFGDTLPTYCSLFDICPTSTHNQFIDYKSKLSTFYMNLTPYQVPNFDLNITFDSNTLTGYEYIQNIELWWGCYGRKNINNEYYKYEEFSYCDFEDNGTSSLDSSSGNIHLQNFNIYDSNDNVISDLSAYDKIFMYLNIQYKDDSKDKVVSNLNISFNGNSYYEDYFLGPIYDSFRNLPDNFKLFLTTSKQDYSYFNAKYVSYDNSSLFSIRRQEYNIYNFQADINPGFLTNYFSRYSVNNSLNTGFMIFESPNSLDEDYFVGLDFVLFPDIIISLRDDTSNNFSYYDNTGSIINSNIDINYNNIPNDNYDLSYYTEQISSFINDMTESSLEFASITQTFYDSMPSIFQLFLFVIFILFCLYFTFILIKH